MFEIIAIADSELLVSILNGVAMLTTNVNFTGMVAFGLLIGLVFTVARALITQRLELQWVLIGWILYATMFLPKVQVTVEDLQTGATDVVANVPIGVAGIGTATSLVGVGLAESFQTVFNPPGSPGAGPAIGAGYADALNLLTMLRDPEYGSVNDGSASTVVANVDVQRTLSRYLKDCVLYAIAMEGSPLSMTWEELRSAPNLLTAIEVPAVSWFTVTYLPGDGVDGTVRTCQAAYTAIAGQLPGFATEWFEYLGSRMDMPNAQTEAQNAIDYVFGVTATAQQFMINSLLAKELELADLNFQAGAGNSAGVMMRTQAMEQRRVQWAAEKSLFEEVARPLMGYIEAFFYAVSPVMAFVFMLGQFGVGLFGRYLMLAAWIQLWMPIMAVNNLYIHHSANRVLESVDAGGTDLMSMVGMNSVWTETASWIAVGGMMAAATPLLALMLLSGSYFAMTQLTNRMAGRDFTNERIMAPDIAQPAAAASAGSLFTQEPRWVTGPMRGTRLFGAEGVAPHFDWDAEAKAREEHLQSRSVAYDNQWRQMSSASIKETMKEEQGFSSALSTVTSNTGQFTQMDQATWKAAESIAEKHVDLSSYSEQEKNSLVGSIGLGIQTGMPLKALAGPGLTGSLRASVEKSKIDETRSADEILDSMSTEIATANQSSAHLSETVAGSESAARNSVFAQAIGMDRAEGFDDVASGMEKTSEALSSVRGHVREMGVEQHMDIVAFGEMYQDQRSRLWQAAVNAGVKEGDVQDAAGVYQNIYGMQQPQAVTAALGTMLAIHDPGAAYSLLAGDQAGVRDGFTPATELPELGSLHRPEDAPQTGVDVSGDDVVGRVQSGLEQGEEQVQGWNTEPQSRYEAWRQEVDDDVAQMREQHREQAGQNHTQRLLTQYAPDNPDKTHPVLQGLQRMQAGAGQNAYFDPIYKPPSPESREGRGILGGFADEAAREGLPADLQGHYARLAAQERYGMTFDADNHPTTEELASRYDHGEQLVGYVENAAHTHTESPRGYLGAASHILEHPLTEADGGAAESPGVGVGGAGPDPGAAGAGYNTQNPPVAGTARVAPSGPVGGPEPAPGVTETGHGARNDPGGGVGGESPAVSADAPGGGAPEVEVASALSPGTGVPASGPAPAPGAADHGASAEQGVEPAAAAPEVELHSVAPDARGAPGGNSTPDPSSAAMHEATRSGGGSSVPAAPVMTAEELADALYEENREAGVPEHTAWVAAQDAVGLGGQNGEGSPEYQEHRAGMEQELGGNARAIQAIDDAAAGYGPGTEGVYRTAMEEGAAAYRDRHADEP